MWASVLKRRFCEEDLKSVPLEKKRWEGVSLLNSNNGGCAAGMGCRKLSRREHGFVSCSREMFDLLLDLDLRW